MKISEGLSTATLPRTSRGRCVTPRPDRFRLDGPSRKPDPRIHAYRPDIADVALAGCLFAPHYAKAMPHSCSADAIDVRSRPAVNAPATSQLCFGEDFAVLDVAGGWAWGRCAHDDYVGYVPVEALVPSVSATHRIVTPLALVFDGPSIKAPVRRSLPFGARIAGTMEGDFLSTRDGFVHARHVMAVDEVERDAVAVAERMVGSPYRWGGRGGDGVDCSGLVQRALEFTGIAAPRDSDMQRDQLGETISGPSMLQRGDLVFFPGHVGLMVDGTRLIHANAFWMSTVIEPLEDVAGRLRPTHAQPITAMKRIAT